MQDSEQQTYVLQAPETCLEPPSQGYSLPMGAGQVERLLEPEQWMAGGACDRRAGLGQAPGSRGGPLPGCRLQHLTVSSRDGMGFGSCLRSLLFFYFFNFFFIFFIFFKF